VLSATIGNNFSLVYDPMMSKRYTITLSDEANEKLLAFIGWSKDSDLSPQKTLQDWLHRLIGLEPPKHGGMRKGGFGREKVPKKPANRRK